MAIAHIQLARRRGAIAPVIRCPQRPQEGQRTAAPKAGTGRIQGVSRQIQGAAHIQRKNAARATVPGQSSHGPGKPGIIELRHAYQLPTGRALVTRAPWHAVAVTVTQAIIRAPAANPGGAIRHGFHPHQLEMTGLQVYPACGLSRGGLAVAIG